MPNYGFTCNDCGQDFDVWMYPSQYTADRVCTDPECGSADTKRYFTTPNVVFKGDGWVDKNLRIKQQMKEKNKILDAKQADRYRQGGKANTVASLAPNVDGEQTDTWAEAKKLATSKGKNTAAYDKYVRSEKSGN